VSFSDGAASIGGTIEPQEEKGLLAAGNIQGVFQVNELIRVIKPEPETKFYTVQSLRILPLR
jgi:hypothetical protein